MEQNTDLNNIKKIFLGKKTKNAYLKNKESQKIDETNKDSILFETSTELSVDNSINLKEKVENIPGLDDINIPSFFNDKTKNNNVNKKIKIYYKTKKELGSNDLAKLFLIDVNRLYKEKEKM